MDDRVQFILLIFLTPESDRIGQSIIYYRAVLCIIEALLSMAAMDFIWQKLKTSELAVNRRS